MLDHVARVAAGAGWTVARAAGTEFEQELAFAGLGSIVGPHLDVVDTLDARYAQPCAPHWASTRARRRSSPSAWRS